MKKKLFLNKQTIIKLNDVQQLEVKGGTTNEVMTWCDCEQNPTDVLWTCITNEYSCPDTQYNCESTGTGCTSMYTGC